MAYSIMWSLVILSILSLRAVGKFSIKFPKSPRRQGYSRLETQPLLPKPRGSGSTFTKAAKNMAGGVVVSSASMGVIQGIQSLSEPSYHSTMSFDAAEKLAAAQMLDTHQANVVPPPQISNTTYIASVKPSTPRLTALVANLIKPILHRFISKNSTQLVSKFLGALLPQTGLANSNVESLILDKANEGEASQAMLILDKIKSHYNLTHSGLHQVRNPVAQKSMEGLEMLFSVLDNVLVERLQSITEVITSLQTTLAGSTNTVISRKAQVLIDTLSSVDSLIRSMVTIVQKSSEEIITLAPNSIVIYTLLAINTFLLIILAIMLRLVQSAIHKMLRSLFTSMGRELLTHLDRAPDQEEESVYVTMSMV